MAKDLYLFLFRVLQTFKTLWVLKSERQTYLLVGRTKKHQSKNTKNLAAVLDSVTVAESNLKVEFLNILIK